MGYGARARRVPALGGASLTDVDIYRLLLLCKTERGLVNSSGNTFVQDEIYSMNDYYPKCGGFNNSYYGPYVAQSFFDELENDLSCEMKVLNFVDDAAAQATYSIMDGATPAVKIFDIKAGRLSLNDKSAFGNKIGIKITQKEDITMKLTAEVLDTATSCVLDNVDNLEVGNYIKFTEGSSTEVRVITGITPSTKTITFAAISESAGFSVSGTTVSRIDWKLEIAVKDDLGDYQKKEEWTLPFAKSDTIGMAKEVNDTESGSDFVVLAVNSSNSSNPEDQIPAELSSWTPLTGGSDGSAPGDSDWNTLAETYLSSETFTIMLAPESSSITHNDNMVSFCTDGYKGIFYCQAANSANEATLKNFGGSLRGSVRFGMIPGDKWIKLTDPTVVSGTKDVPKVGIDAASWFNTFSRFGEAKVAAGNRSEMVLRTRGKLVDNGLTHDDSLGVGDRLIRNYSVNICKFRRGIGITNNSARTLSTDDGYKYQNQIMQSLLYSRSIVAYLRNIEQDKSGIDSQRSHYNEVWAYMKNKYNDGKLYQGQKEDGSLTQFSDVCIIKNDFSVNTLADINNGIEVIFMQFVAPPPIEEPILSFASASVTTVRG